MAAATRPRAVDFIAHSAAPLHQHRDTAELSTAQERELTQHISLRPGVPQADEIVVSTTRYRARRYKNHRHPGHYVPDYLVVVLSCIEGIEGPIAEVVVENKHVGIIACCVLAEDCRVAREFALLRLRMRVRVRELLLPQMAACCAACC